jgi:hypothetical protein
MKSTPTPLERISRLALVGAEEPQHLAQVLEVDQLQPARVGVVEHQAEHAGLDVVEVQDLGQQRRTVLVLPVPVAPATSPCRFSMASGTATSKPVLTSSPLTARPSPTAGSANR